MLEQKLNKIKHTKVLLTPKRKEKIVSKVPLNIDVLIELSGIITQCHALLHLILSNAQTFYGIITVQITKY